MKVVVINFGGNLGKTTLSAYFLYPRLGGPKMIAVESINETAKEKGLEVDLIRGDRFKEIYRELVVNESVIVDVGASNVEGFLEGLSSFENGHDEVDLFLIPVTSGKKEQAESIKTALVLSLMGVKKERISLVFNRVERSVDEEFPETLRQCAIHNKFVANPKCRVFENDIYVDLGSLGLSVDEACDLNDHSLDQLKADLISGLGDPDQFLLADKRLSVAKRANKTRDQLDAAFQALVGH
ncbi:StbB family protein [Pseudomonas sp. D(2018)]|uniref:StbB family protein n=1 Tax=Pseudomonas sp. D(2018) TaxID=2502238 RepID=UPI0010F9D2DB|nr:StbB family protein [Pseudomonas sp. D(2018)]